MGQYAVMKCPYSILVSSLLLSFAASPVIAATQAYPAADAIKMEKKEVKTVDAQCRKAASEKYVAVKKTAWEKYISAKKAVMAKFTEDSKLAKMNAKALLPKDALKNAEMAKKADLKTVWNAWETARQAAWSAYQSEKAACKK